MKRNLLLGVACLLGLSAVAQQDPVLMRINGKPVPRSEFETAYSKQKSLANPQAQTPAAYVDLFVDFKLKVSAAESAGIDTTRAFRQELADYRSKLTLPYLIDEEAEEADARQVYHKMKSALHTGQVQVIQLFTALPQNLSAVRIRLAEARMDSFYTVLKQSPDATFTACVERYSDDKKRSWVSELQTTQEFENVVFSLQKGEVSPPFYTPQGIHIVKVIDRKELPSFESVRSETRRRLSYRQGVDKSTAALVEKLKGEYAYTPDVLGVEELLSKGETSRPLFTVDGRAYSGTQFKRFATSYPRGVKAQLDAFVAKMILDIQHARLEQSSPALRLLVQEQRDRLLVSQITAREVSIPATSDEAGLSTFFQLHRSDYNWKQPRYRGVVLHSADKKSIRQAKRLMKAVSEQQWSETIRQTLNPFLPERVKTEQGVFSEGDNKYVDKLVFKKGSFEPLESYPFTVVVGAKQKGPSSYKEVRKQLSADYRIFLDALWIKRLRAESKVEINQEVLKTVNNH